MSTSILNARQLDMNQLKHSLLQFGMQELEIDNMMRWDRIREVASRSRQQEQPPQQETFPKDLRDYTMDQLGRKCLQFGTSQETVNSMMRWDRIRQISTFLSSN